jgi:parallel beta-helix repeat protein
MNSRRKLKLNLIAFLFIFSPIFSVSLSYLNDTRNNSGYINNFTLDKGKLKISDVSEKIHIDNNWTAAKAAGICTGNGTYSEPYVIEDLEIDGGGSGSCILIENSDVYFKIENCSLYNAGSNYQNAGIRFYNVTKGTLGLNNCTYSGSGIFLSASNNNTISGNIANSNDYGILLDENCINNIISANIVNNTSHGIYLYGYCNNNTISGNFANNNSGYYGGIFLSSCNNNTISGNIVNNSAHGIYLYYCDHNAISGNIANNNSHGIYLESCDYSTILGNNVTNSYEHQGYDGYGIYLKSSDHSTISENIANNNSFSGVCLSECQIFIISGNTANNNDYGIYLDMIYSGSSEHNAISGNTANYNSHGIYLSNCDYITISGNTASYNFNGIYLWANNNYNTISDNNANNNNYYGIYLSSSEHNTILGNTANNNTNFGIFLKESNYNNVSGNTLLGNDKCIGEINCEGNTFSDNGNCTYGQENPENPAPLISSYNIYLLLGILSIISIIIKKKVKKS